MLPIMAEAEAARGWPAVVEGDGDVTLTWRGTTTDPAATLEATLLAVLDFTAGAALRAGIPPVRLLSTQTLIDHSA